MDFDGTPLNTRIHWAKESPRIIEVDGIQHKTMEYVHMNYAEQMTKFFNDLNQLTDGVSIQDINDLFSNRYLDEVFQPQWERFQVSLPSKNYEETSEPNEQDRKEYDGCTRFCNLF